MTTSRSADAEIESLRREIERLQLSASRERTLLEAVFTQSPYGIIVSDRHGKLTLQNRAAETIWAGSATASNVEGWMRYRAFHADGRPYAAGDWAMTRSLNTGAVVGPEEYRVQKFDDTFGTLLGSCAPILAADGSVDGALSIFADITPYKIAEDNLRVAEERRRFIAQAMAILAGSLDYQVTLASVANLAVPRIADWCAVDLAGPKGALERLAVVHSDPSRVALAHDLQRRYPEPVDSPTGIYNVLRTGKPEMLAAIPDELLVAGARDAEHLALLRGLGLRSYIIMPLRARGRTLGTLTFVTSESNRVYGPADLTLAEELSNAAAIAIDNAQLYKESRDAVRTREDLLTVVSHDLRNPLGVVSMQTALVAAMLPNDEAGERVRKGLDKIQRAADRMETLVKDLLDFGSIEAGTFSVAPSVQPASELLCQAVDLLSSLTAKKSLTLSAHPHDADVSVRCDRHRVLQVFSNLIGNAIKFTPAGGTIAVASAAEPDYVRFSVSDSGPGIPDGQVEHLFERYWQAQGGDGRGVGLGLYIAKAIVDAHHGKLWVDSVPGRGATFHFTLPLAS